MPAVTIFDKFQVAAVWAMASKQGPGSRHEMFAKLGIQCRNFCAPNFRRATDVMAEFTP